MWFALQNEENKEFRVKKGEAFGQGIFLKYYIVDDEDEVQEERNGWTGKPNSEK